MVTRALCLALITVVAVGCTHQPSTQSNAQREIQQEIVVDHAFDTVWADLITLFADLNIPIRTLEKDSGLIATEYQLVDHGGFYLDCGQRGLLQVMSNPSMNINVIARTDEIGRTTVRTNVFGTAVIADTGWALGARTVKCVTTGAFEDVIARKVM